MSSIRVLQYGLGPIGCAIARVAADRAGVEVVGGVDIDAAKSGRRLKEVAGLSSEDGAQVWSAAAEALLELEPDVVLHSTSSSLRAVMPQLIEIVEAGCSVISTCEELAYPRQRYPDESARLDQAAIQHGVTVLGTGVNPGFVMDTLVFFMSAVVERIDRLEVSRVVDASKRRLPLQQKIGAALDLAEFKRLAETGTLRHVGLEESVWMVAAALGWQVDRLDVTIEPIVAERDRRSQELVARPGQSAGVHQRVVGLVGGEMRLVWDLKMQLEADEPGDEVRVFGNPPLHLRVHGGIHGDAATAAIMVNAIPRVMSSKPGLVTMLDIPPVVRWS